MRLDRLSAEDRLILWPDAVWPQDIGALGILAGDPLLGPDGDLRLDVVRDVVGSRLHLVPRSRQVLLVPRTGLGGPLWIDAPSFDLTQHVQATAVPPPGDDVQLLRTVERLRRRPLDRSRPLWELWLLTGLPDDRLGLFVRLHHAIADGVAGMATLARLLDPDPTGSAPIAPPPWTPEPGPTTRDLLTDNLRRRTDGVAERVSGLRRPAAGVRAARTAVPTLRTMLTSEPGPRTSLDRVIGQDRTLALVRDELAQVRGAAHRHGATINDVLLTVIAGGLRTLLHSRGEPVEGLSVPIYVPVSLRREAPGEERGNLIGQMVVRLPVGTADPAERLALIALETTRQKAVDRPSLGAMFGNRLVRGALLQVVVRKRVNVASADLIGPRTPRSFVGAELLELYPLLNLVGNQSVGVGALSYAGRFGIMMVADAATVPDLEVLAAGMRADLAALAASDVSHVTAS
jgi:diacylglycerol O-acyltransferase / wax synthase